MSPLTKSGRIRTNVNKEMMTEHEFALNTLKTWGFKETALRLGVVGAFYLLEEEPLRDAFRTEDGSRSQVEE